MSSAKLQHSIHTKALVSSKKPESLAQMLLQVTKSTSKSRGAEYFSCLVRELANILDIHQVQVSQFTQNKAKVLAQWNSPCFSKEKQQTQQTTNKQIASSSHLQSTRGLYRLGIVLKNARDERIGRLELLHYQNSNQLEQFQTLLELIEARTSTELELLIHNQKSIPKNMTLPSAEIMPCRISSYLHLRDFVNHAKDLIQSVKLEDGSFVFVNQAWIDILGYDKKELVTLTFFDVLSPTLAPHCRELFSQMQKGVCPVLENIEITFLSKLGKEIPVEGSLNCHFVGGRPTAVRAIFRDISKRKEYEQTLQKKNERLARETRYKDEFLASMSHELRTPLNAILGMSENLKDKEFGSMDEKQHKAVLTIEKSGRLLLALINDVLDLAKIGANKTSLEFSLTNIPQLFHATTYLVDKMAKDKELTLCVEIPEELERIPLHVDERRIRQVLLNLLTNAIKFTPKRGKITLSVEATSELPQSPPQEMSSPSLFLRFSVTDTGIGIPPEHFSDIFEPFLQVDGKFDRQHQGTGLGLAFVKGIVHLHGGFVAVQSPKQQGTSIYFTIPSQPPDEIMAQFPQSSAQQNPRSQDSMPSLCDVKIKDKPLILLAEDNEDNTYCVTSYLKRRGYEFIIATNGEEALTLAETHDPDIILMDIQMPKMNGFEAIKQLRCKSKHTTTPIISVTAMAMSGDREKCLQAGANDCLAKPFRLKELEKKIKHFLQLS